jgi:hypothetical protein
MLPPEEKTMRFSLIACCLALVSSAAPAAEPTPPAGYEPSAQTFKERAHQVGGLPAAPFTVCQKPKPSWVDKTAWSDGEGASKVLFGVGQLRSVRNKSMGLTAARSRAMVSIGGANSATVTETSSSGTRTTRVQSRSVIPNPEFLDCYFAPDDSVYVLMGSLASEVVEAPKAAPPADKATPTK